MTPIRLRGSIALAVGLVATMLLFAAPAGAAGLPPAGVKPHTVLDAGCSLDLRAAFSHCNMKLLGNLKQHPLAAAAPGGRLRPGRPAERLRAPEQRAGARPDRRDRRRLRRPERRGRPRASTAPQYGLPRLHDGQRLLQEGQPERRQGSYPAGNAGWGAGDLARPRHGLGDLPELPHPARRGDIERQRQPRHGGEHGRARSARPRSRTATAAASPQPDPRNDSLLQPPGRRDHGALRRQRLRRRVPGRLAVRHRGRRHDPHARRRNARGWTETAWSGAGSGCSAYEAKPSWQTDTGCAKRTVADVSAVADPNTGVAVYDSTATVSQLLGSSAGASSAARAPRRRSSRRCTRWPATRRARRTARTRTRTPRR